MATKEDCTLLVRHLPASLSLEEREDLLRFFGARSVRCMQDVGAMRNSAFAEFPSPASAKHALAELHQLQVQGSRLSAHFSKRTFLPEIPKHNAETKPDKPKVEVDPEPVVPKNIDSLAPGHKIDYPFNPRLLYSYPQPTVEILTNIANTLAAVPKFYVQVLHLMNKMNLPVPFGPMTQTPPIASGISEEPAPEIEMDVSSTEESELESEDDGKPIRDLPVKRPLRTKLTKPIIKRRKLQTTISAPRTGKTLRRDEVFERATKEKMKPVNRATDTPSSVVIPHIGDVRKFVTLRELQRNRLSSRRMRKSTMFRDYDAGARSSTLLIDNLHKDVPEAMITFVYGRYINWENEAESKAYSVCLDRDSRSCTVTFPSDDIAQLALEETNGYRLMGEYMVVKFLPKAAESPAAALEEKNGNLEKSDEKRDSDNPGENRDPENTQAIQAAFSVSADAEMPDAELRAATPELMERAETPNSIERAETPDSIERAKTPDSIERAKTPESMERAKTPESMERAKTPDSERAKTPDSERAGTPETIIPRPISDDPRYISSSELESGRISSDEMTKIKVFNNYKPGDKSNRIYVKNLSKKTEINDLVWVFGRFVEDRSVDAETVLDVKLMKEGRMKGQAFITFPSVEEAGSAVQHVNGFTLIDKPIAVQFGKTT